MPRLDGAEMRRRVSRARVARLATVGPDGRPHVVPFTFALDGDVIYSAVDAKPKSGRRLRRLDNVVRNPHVSVLVDHYADDWDALWWVRIDGEASVVGGGDAFRRALDALEEKYEQYRRRRPPGPVIVVTAVRWTGWTAG